MNTENEYSLIYQIKNNNEGDCSKAVTSLMQLHNGLIHKELSKYCSPSGSGINLLDVANDKELITYKAAKSYDETRGTKFSTFLANMSRFHALSLVKTHKKHSVCIGMEEGELSDVMDGMNRGLKSKDIAENNDSLEYIMSLAADYKDKRITEILSLRYLNSARRIFGFEEIGQMLSPSLSRQGVKNILDGFMSYAKVEMKLDGGII